MGEPRRHEIAVPEEVLGDLSERLRRTRWPELTGDWGWQLGANIPYLRELCSYWADSYDWRATERRLNAYRGQEWDGIHFWRDAGEGAGDGLPVLLVHGWPGAPIEFEALMPFLTAAGHDIVVPSLPGYAFSEAPDPPMNAKGAADRLRALMDALGYERYAVQGGDWGSVICGRMALDDPEHIAAIHVNSVGVMPTPGSFDDPPMTEGEQAYAQEGMRWRTRRGFHLFVHAGAPDGLAVALEDSPAGLAAWLVEKYTRWSDCDGAVEKRFTKDQLCDFLTIYWATGTIGSSMRMYAAEARDRWKLGPGEAIHVPAAAADFPKELVRPPEEWARRVMPDLRRFTEMPRGGHFAAHEEPELLAGDIIGFLAELG